MGRIKEIAEATEEELEDYLVHQGWIENPFSHDARIEEYVLPSDEDIADVAAALRSYTGPVLIHSRFSGVGKTTLLRMMLTEYEEDMQTVAVPEHNVTAYELASIVADEIGVGKSSSTKLTEAKIRDWAEDYDGEPVLLGIDEFGLNDPETLHVIQFLNDLEPIRVILTGMTSQWEAIGDLGSDGRAFQRRVSLVVQLEPFSLDQTKEMLRRRIANAREDNPEPEDLDLYPFTDDAIATVHENAKGVPAVATAACSELIGLAAYQKRQSGVEVIDQELAMAAEYSDPEVE